MISATDFDGKKLAKPTPLIVTWKQGMRFTGRQAVFRGFVQADQESTTVLCDNMQVDLNKSVSLKQQAAGTRTKDSKAPAEEQANVDKVICDAGPDNPQGVIITDTVRENGRLVSTKRIGADEVVIHKEEGWMDAANHGTGRGTVRIVQLGPKSEPGGLPAKTGSAPKAPGRPAVQSAPSPQPVEQEYKATLVRYTGTMKVNNQSRTANFREGVEMLHLPVEIPEQQVQFDATVNKLPPQTLYLRSQQMTVYSTKDANGASHQVMVATVRATVTWGEEFFGTGDVIKFDETKQQLTLEGLNGNVASARRLGPGGGNRGDIKARKIIYNRVDDTVSIEGAYSATGR
jgi:lipopolysaccharide export system protein LptA